MPAKTNLKDDALREASEHYLQQHYCTLTHLLETSDLSDAEFFAYIKAKCLPRHSYEWQEKSAVHSFLSAHEWGRHTIFYYHPRHILLLHDLIIWHRYMSFEDMAKALKDDFKVHYVAKLKDLDAFSDVLSDYADKPAALDEFLEGEWQSYLDGKYGLCIRDPTPENIATEEIMLKRIQLLTDNSKKTSLSAAEKEPLKHALSLLDTVLSPFAPYERAHSPRALCLEAIVAKYAL